MNSWTILCDFDGTISVDDVTDVLLERFGRPGWQALEGEWHSGRLSSRLCMQGQIALLDVGKDELDAQIDELRIDPAFPAFVRAARRAGHELSIVSDGLDYAIRRILARHGLTDIPIHANHLIQDGPRSWRLESPFADKSCRVDSGTCKCVCAQKAQKKRTHVMLVGDGASDFCAAERVDFVFAKYRLNEHCRAKDIHHVSIVGFADAIDLLPALVGELDEQTSLRQQAISYDFNTETISNA